MKQQAIPCALRAFVVSAIALCLSANLLTADELILPSGERLIGTVVRTEGDTIVFLSAALGEVRVAAAGATLTITPPAAPEQAAAPAPEPEPDKNAPTLPPASAAVPIPIPDSPSIAWKRSLEAGLSFQSRGEEFSKQDVYLRGDVTLSSGDNLASFYARYLFGEQNDENSADKFEGGFKLNVVYRSRIILRNNLSYSYDRLKDLSNQVEDVGGLSFIVFKEGRFRYRIGPGIAAQYAEPGIGSSGWKLLGDVSHEALWRLTEKVSATHTGSWLYNPSDWNDYRLRLTNALSCEIDPSVSVTLRYEYEYEALRAVAFGRSDHRVFTTLGYRF